MITFRFSGRQPTPNTYTIGQETDQNAEVLRFILPQVADDQTATLMMLLPDATPDALNIQDGMATVPASVCAQPGRIRAWVEILSNSGDIAWNSEMLYLDVGDLPPISEEVERQYPTALQEAMAAVGRVMQSEEIIQQSIENAGKSARKIIEDAQAAGHAMAYGAGGVAKQVLVKKSGTDFDAEWQYAKDIKPYANDSRTLGQMLEEGPFPSIDAGYHTNAGYHNSLYRGKSLGDTFTADQAAEIAAGTFTGMYVGDFWLIDSVVWRIAGFDLYRKTAAASGSVLNAHHVVVVPDEPISNSNAWISGSHDTSGGYAGQACLIRSTINFILQQNTKFNPVYVFGDGHVLAYKQLYPSSYDANGKATNFEWVDARVELMNECMVHGHQVFGSSGHEVGIDRQQMPLFRLNPETTVATGTYWLRDVVDLSTVATVSWKGSANKSAAVNTFGIRPFFLLG